MLNKKTLLIKAQYLTLAAFLAYLPIGAVSAQTFTSTTSSSTVLQDDIDANTQEIVTLNQQIATYQSELQTIGANKQTLQAAINGLNIQKSEVETKMSVTKAQISITNAQVAQLGTEINSTQQTISTEQAALAKDLTILQQADNQQLLSVVLSSNDLDQAWSNVNATIQIEEAIEQNMSQLKNQENNLSTSQAASQQKQQNLTAEQQTLTSQQQSLVSNQQSKTELLAETNSQESTYEKLLASAQAQLASFSQFTENAGGAGLIGSQTVCDAWGCYYNQRDSAWGGDALDNTKFDLASDGCLVTSLAMVMTHYGYKDVTPITINSNPSNFAPYYPAYLLTTVEIDGTSVSRKTAGIDAVLATGNPVIVGLHAYGGTHYVVFVSGSNGNYIMRDPYIINGDNISFSAHYSLRDIFSASKVVIA